MTAPYYADESVTLYHGRWEQLIPESFTADVVIADPPYGETSLSSWPPSHRCQMPRSEG